VSRWRLADFDQIARAAQLKLVGQGGDTLFGSDIEHVCQAHNRLAPVLGKPGFRGGDALSKLVSFAYRKTGMKFVFPSSGRSIYGYFAR
jgi:hypothetical protein